MACKEIENEIVIIKYTAMQGYTALLKYADAIKCMKYFI